MTDKDKGYSFRCMRCLGGRIFVPRGETTIHCPHCGEYIDLYPPGGVEKAAQDFSIQLLGKIPFEIEVSQQGDQGLPFILKYPESESTKAFKITVNFFIIWLPPMNF